MTIIEKRTERIKFWLTDKELKQIDRKAKRLGMNRSEYIRHIIANCKLVHTPSTMLLSTLKTESPKVLLMPMLRKSLFLKTILNGICDSAGMTRLNAV